MQLVQDGWLPYPNQGCSHFSHNFGSSYEYLVHHQSEDHVSYIVIHVSSNYVGY